MFYKLTSQNTITMIGKSSVAPTIAEEITEEKYNQLMTVIQAKPDDTLEKAYYLSAETETYIERETTHDEKVNWYVSAVLSEQMTIEEVPTEYRQEVEAALPQPEQKTYTLDEAASILAQEVSNE